MLIGMRKRECIKVVSDPFDAKNYSIQYANYFMTTLKRIEDRIIKLKVLVKKVEDKSVQVSLTPKAA